MVRVVRVNQVPRCVDHPQRNKIMLNVQFNKQFGKCDRQFSINFKKTRQNLENSAR
jgi:hypothetical protein